MNFDLRAFTGTDGGSAEAPYMHDILNSDILGNYTCLILIYTTLIHTLM